MYNISPQEHYRDIEHQIKSIQEKKRQNSLCRHFTLKNIEWLSPVLVVFLLRQKRLIRLSGLIRKVYFYKRIQSVVKTFIKAGKNKVKKNK